MSWGPAFHLQSVEPEPESLLAAYLVIAILAIYLWKTILAVKHRIYRVNLHRISEAIKRCMKKNSELVEEISRCTQKDDIETLEKMNEILDDVIREIHTELRSKRDQSVKNRNLVQFSPHGVHVSKEEHHVQKKNAQLENEKDQSSILRAGSEDSKHRALTSHECSLEESKKKRQDRHAASGSVKVGKEAKFLRQKNVDFLEGICGQRKKDAEKKLDMKGCELVEKKHLLAVEQKLKLAEEEIQMYKRRVEELQQEMQETEDSFKYRIALLEEVAQDNWLWALDQGRATREMRWEVAYLKQRLEEICRQRQAEEYTRQRPISRGPYRLHPPLRDSGPGAVPVRNDSACLTEEAEEAQVGMDAGEPCPFPGPSCMPYFMGGPPPFTGYWPPPPGPTWCPPGCHPLSPPPPYEQFEI
ncbi:transport and Golgi organization protein 1 homolog [Vicugna pacos]|uniref:Transport and Golgi organization protein 1 homolog n=1 Tax=Vicugna pacos TaxID=30538 RepID=A0ABM5DL28_VICPA